VLVINADNEITAPFKGNGVTRSFSRKGSADVCLQGDMICRDGAAVLNTREIVIPGVHNVENYMAAILAVEGLVEDEIIRKVAREFGGVEHRIELVRVKDGVKFYNDSIASSPSRTIAGLNSFSEKLLLIAGGYDKHIPYEPMVPYVLEKVEKLLLCGATAEKIETAVRKDKSYNGTPEIIRVENIAQAVDYANKNAKSGDVVTLSPASASFDCFPNFVARGNHFKELVQKL
jgi:UDP-N-acetylmuramoylalanine--D-glutamate ligase